MKKTRFIKWILGVVAGLLLLALLFAISSRFKGEKEQVSFSSDIPIEGLFLKPEGAGPHPAILLLHGSGSSHQEYNKLYFKFHANAFLEKGFAVLVYTKRGSGKHAVDYDNFTYKQLLDDAGAALKFIRQQKDVDQEKVGIMGLSESGWFTPELALLDGNIKFIINRVSSPFSYTKTVIHEVKMDARDEGFTKKEISKHIVPITERIWQFYIDVYRDPSLANGPERVAINQLLAEAHKDDRLGKWFTFDELTAYDSLRYNSRGKRYSYDPMPHFKKLECPLFYVMGEKDVNMPTKEVVDFLENYRQTEGKKIDIKVYEGASHYLYKYGLKDGPFEGWLYHNGYLDLLSSWASDQVN
ncbi:MAG: alpha/beta hydrolase family protein [Flavobacteriaceae bacterium]